MEPARVEAIESELDRIIEKRAAERKDAKHVEDVWRESARVHEERLREENRAVWYGYHMDQAERIERVASQIAATHRERAEELASEELASENVRRPHREEPGL